MGFSSVAESLFCQHGGQEPWKDAGWPVRSQEPLGGRAEDGGTVPGHFVPQRLRILHCLLENTSQGILFHKLARTTMD